MSCAPTLVTALRHACHNAARGKRCSQDIAAFLLDPAPRVQQLAADLDARLYRPGRGLRKFFPSIDSALLRAHQAAATEQRANALRLRLHPQKTRLHRTTDPVA